MESGVKRKTRVASWFSVNRKCNSEMTNCHEDKSDVENGVALWDDSNPVERTPAGWKAMPYILGNETFERLGTYGLMANFMVYLQKIYRMDPVTAATILNTWNGATNFTPVIGAFISDAFIGKFLTIAYGSFAAILGMSIVTLTALVPNLHPSECTEAMDKLGQFKNYTKAQFGILILGLIGLSIGTGGIRPCSIPFGIDQFDVTTEEGRKGNNRFYNWYYHSQTVVLLIISTLVVYIQNDVSWALGFGLPTIFMVLAVVLFFLGTNMYIYVNPEGSIFSGVLQVFVAAYKKRRLQLPADGDESVNFYDPPLKKSLIVSKLPLTKKFRFLNKAAIIEAKDVNTDGTCKNPWRLSSVQQIEDVKSLLNIIPIWFTSILGFLAMNQQGTLMVSQALKMERHLGPHFEIPPGSISIISLLTIGVWLPLYDIVLIPTLEKITKIDNGITILQRAGLGNIFAILTLLAAGITEAKRRNLALDASDGVAPMHVLWLAPQFIFLGFAEVNMVIGLIEFYNKQFPQNMRSIGNALLYLTYSVAGYASSLVITIVHNFSGRNGARNWLTDDVNTSRLDYLYYLMAGLEFVNLLGFLVCAHRYRYKGGVKAP